jgi:PAS domain S-box-containing protein
MDGVIMMDHQGRISFWNKAASEMFGYPELEALGQNLHALLAPQRFHAGHHEAFPHFQRTGEGTAVGKLVELVGRRRNGQKFPLELSLAPIQIGENWHAVGIIRDITQRKLAETEQRVNIEIAQQLLRLVDRHHIRHVELDNQRELFVQTVSATCKAAGGDHGFAATIGGHNGQAKRTIVSLKDQSGHEVNCILRSIATDLIHHAVLTDTAELSLEGHLARVNDQLCESGMFMPGDFVTSVTVEIDHATRMMRYVCCGHPPLLVIRGTEVHLLSQANTIGRGLPLGIIPAIEYTAWQWQLEDGDRVLLYTDGLIEMPLRNCGKRITPEELKSMVKQLVTESPELPVSTIIRQLLEMIMESCQEDVVPGALTSAEDDVTLVGLEIERKDRATQVILRPRDSDDLSDAIERIHLAIRSELAANRFEAADVDVDARLRVLLEEMILNAWQHGSRHNPDLPITVRWQSRNDLVLEVIDQGDGFDPQVIADPRYGDRRLAQRGRGILLIRRSCDAVYWRSGGRNMIASIMRKLHPSDARHGIAHVPPNPPPQVLQFK